MRTIRVINTRTSQPFTLTSDATNFGEIKEIITQMSEFDGEDFKSYRCVVRDKNESDPNRAKRTVSLNHEPLPTGNFILYITPLKVSQGAVKRFDYEELYDIRGQLVGVLDFIDDVLEVADDEDGEVVVVDAETYEDRDEDNDDYTQDPKPKFDLTDEELDDIAELND